MLTSFQKFFVILFFLIQTNTTHPTTNISQQDLDVFLEKNNPQSLNPQATIESISIVGSKSISTDVLLKKIPFQKGALLDPQKTNIAISNLYSFGAFKQVEIKAKEVGSKIHIIIDLQEKFLLEGVEFVNNKEISSKKIEEVLNLKKISYIDDDSARNLISLMKQFYISEGYHRAQISYKLKQNSKVKNKVTVIFSIKEGEKASVQMVNFIGNKKIPSRKLRNAIFTKERWLLGFSDGSGSFDERKIEQDRYYIEGYYFENGFFNTKVYKTDIKFSENKRDVAVTFYIEEGEQYTIKSVTPPSDEIISTDQALEAISTKEGKPLIRHELLETRERLSSLWKEKGYIYTEVLENVRPNDATKEIDLTYMVNPGKKLYVNRINISGNKNTRDSLIRRRLDILEGDLITNSKLENSKRAVEFLSFYERGGVNWIVHRVADDLADLELNVKETKTGNFNTQLSYGPSGESNQKQEFQGSILLEKGNLLGHGIDSGIALKAGFDKARPSLRRFEVRLIDPHIFDKDISCAFYLYRRWDEYDRWKALSIFPSMHTVGANVRFGFGLPDIDKYLSLMFDVGVETIHNNNPKVPLNSSSPFHKISPLYQVVVDQSFQQGTLLWAGLDLVKDMRNHQVYPSKGYKFSFGTKIAPGGLNQTFEFLKIEASASMYNALLNEDDIVLGNHIKCSNIYELNSKKSIPYKELFHMGGPTTIRGHVWSGIGPAWKTTNEPLGGRYAIQSNNEITFPLAKSLGMRAHVFYDAGAAWDMPDNAIKKFNTQLPINQRISLDDVVIRNKFHLRHTVGFGLNLTSPIPAKIDWGFKLDRQPGESSHEFHLTMNYAW